MGSLPQSLRPEGIEERAATAPQHSRQQTVTLFKGTPLLLENGKAVSHVRVAYHTYGQPSAQATLVLHALTGDSAAHQWWPQMLGAGKALDPQRGYLVCSNVVGGCAGSSGVAELGLQPGDLSLVDMARVQRELLRVLGVERIDIIGASMGGMLAYAWLATFPELVRRAVIIAAPARHSSWAIGLNTAARSAILSAPGGEGLKVARQFAMLSYRSPQSLNMTQSGPSARNPQRPAVSTYLEYQGEKLAQRFCEQSYLTLTYAMDALQLGPEALGRVQVPALVVGISSDVLYPAAEVREQSTWLPKAEYWELNSLHGHDAFLMDSQDLEAQVAHFLQGEE